MPQSIGQRIAHARRQLGIAEGRDLTPPDIAERVGVSGTTVYNWEGDVSPPSRKNLGRLAEVLGVSESWLEYGIDAARRLLPSDETDAHAHVAKTTKAARSRAAKKKGA